MRAMFGLAALLVTVGVVAWIMSSFYLPYTKAVLNAQKSMQPTLNRVAAQGEDRLPSSSSAVLIPIEKNGQLRGLAVQSVVIGGAMDTTYGLLPGDIILQIHGIPIGDPYTATVQDESSAKDFLFVDAYRGNWPLTVDRGGTVITLPKDRAFVPSAPVPANTNGTGTNSAAPNTNSTPLDNAADVVKQLQNQ